MRRKNLLIVVGILLCLSLCALQAEAQSDEVPRYEVGGRSSPRSPSPITEAAILRSALAQDSLLISARVSRSKG